MLPDIRVGIPTHVLRMFSKTFRVHLCGSRTMLFKLVSFSCTRFCFVFHLLLIFTWTLCVNNGTRFLRNSHTHCFTLCIFIFLNVRIVNCNNRHYVCIYCMLYYQKSILNKLYFWIGSIYSIITNRRKIRLQTNIYFYIFQYVPFAEPCSDFPSLSSKSPWEIRKKIINITKRIIDNLNIFNIV